MNVAISSVGYEFAAVIGEPCEEGMSLGNANITC